MPNIENSHTVTMHGNVLTLRGKNTDIGDNAPNFTASKQDLTEFDFYKETKNKIKVISVVPSVDTGVCALQTQRFNQEATALSEDVAIITISVDLPFALKRFCAAEGIKNIQVVSDYKSLDFGEKYGFIINELKLLTRGILVIDKDNKVQYVEYVGEVSNHPDYEKAIGEVKKLINI
jgi:thioredoxin-dependent peroxiredoxin